MKRQRNPCPHRMSLIYFRGDRILVLGEFDFLALEIPVDNRWRILAVLVVARLVMGMQFESVGALGPLLKAEGLDYGQLGILVGAYLAPGLLVALPGGMAVQRFGERTAILICLLLMTLGAALDL